MKPAGDWRRRSRDVRLVSCPPGVSPRQWMRESCVTISSNHPGNDHLIAAQPVRLGGFRLKVRGILHQHLQRFQRLPVIHVGCQPRGGTLPCFLTQIHGVVAGRAAQLRLFRRETRDLDMARRAVDRDRRADQGQTMTCMRLLSTLDTQAFPTVTVPAQVVDTNISTIELPAPRWPRTPNIPY